MVWDYESVNYRKFGKCRKSQMRVVFFFLIPVTLNKLAYFSQNPVDFIMKDVRLMAEEGWKGIKGLRLEKYFWILSLWGRGLGWIFLRLLWPK